MAATFFGHPRGLATLFLTEMWERFTFYGMRAVLILFLVASVATGGLGLDDKTAAAIYGLYTAAVYLAALPGGWVADRLIGAQRAVMLGGAFITAGNLLLAISTSGCNAVTVDVANSAPQPALFQQNIPVVLVGHFQGNTNTFAAQQILVKHSNSYIAAHPNRVRAPNGTTH